MGRKESNQTNKLLFIGSHCGVVDKPLVLYTWVCRFVLRLHQSVGWDLKLFPHLHMTLDVCGLLKTNIHTLLFMLFQPMLRSAAIGALNAWVDQTTLTPLVECEALSDGLKLENPNLRQEVRCYLKLHIGVKST